MKSLRNPNASFQDHKIVKSFKKQLIRIGLEPVFEHGHLPVWGWQSGQPAIVAYEYVHDVFFVLPVTGLKGFRSMVSGIRQDKPIENFTYCDKNDAAVTVPFSHLSETDVIRALKNLSLVVFAEENQQKAFHFRDGKKFILLKSGQLLLTGRLGKTPLQILIKKSVGRIIRYGDFDLGLDSQLLNEHKIPKSDVDAFYAAARELKLNLSECAKDDKAGRSKLIRPLRKKIKEYCEARKTKS